HLLPASLQLGGGEVATGPRVGAGGSVRGAGGLLDLPAGAAALVDQACRRQLPERRVVGVPSRGLMDRRAVPVDAQRLEVLQLPCLGPLAHPVQILHPQMEGAAGSPGQRPGQDRGAQVPQMQVPTGGGGVASGARPGRRGVRLRRRGARCRAWPIVEVRPDCATTTGRRTFEFVSTCRGVSMQSARRLAAALAGVAALVLAACSSAVVGTGEQPLTVYATTGYLADAVATLAP